MTAPASASPSPDERAGARIKEFTNWWTKVWESGAAGKIGIILVLSAFALPFLFDLAAAFFVWFVVWPFAINVTEKLAVLGFIFVVTSGPPIVHANVSATDASAIVID